MKPAAVGICPKQQPEPAKESGKDRKMKIRDLYLSVPLPHVSKMISTVHKCVSADSVDMEFESSA